MIKLLHTLALFWVKNTNSFAKYIGENILKNHNIGLRLGEVSTIGSIVYGFLITEEVQFFWGYFFRGKSDALNLSKIVLGYILGDFLTNSTDHPG
jgi:hypothetical protein